MMKIPKTKEKRKSPRNLEACRLYGILDTTWLDGRDPARVSIWMMEGGVDILQIRAKHSSPSEIRTMAEAVLTVTRSAGIPLIINDFPDIAAEVDADGVHIGQDDGSVVEARKIVGPHKWIGKSTHSMEQALAAENEKADYIGVGPVFATPTKPDYPPVGLDLVQRVSRKLKIPFFCIGGIKIENAADVLAAGGHRLVVVSGILQASDITDYCRSLRKQILQK